MSDDSFITWILGVASCSCSFATSMIYRLREMSRCGVESFLGSCDVTQMGDRVTCEGEDSREKRGHGIVRFMGQKAQRCTWQARQRLFGSTALKHTVEGGGAEGPLLPFCVASIMQ